MGFLSPKLPTPTVDKSPAPDTAEVQKAAAKTAERRTRDRGFRSTILSQSFLAKDQPGLKTTFGS